MMDLTTHNRSSNTAESTKDIKELSVHRSVLLNELVGALQIQQGDTIVDATAGSGGHSKLACSQLGKSGTLIAIDMDTDALSRSKKQLDDLSCKKIFQEGNFRDIQHIINSLGIEQVDGVMFDLGFNSYQIENSGRGFSFRTSEPLLMTFKKVPNENDITADSIINSWDEEHIADILYGYGEERFARKIARGIITARKIKKIDRTVELVDIVKASTPWWYHSRRIHPATKTFQALRIAVNDEVETLRNGLKETLSILKQGSRLAVISFHSIEDRVVKQFFNGMSKDGYGMIITKKPIVPQRDEILLNPRARSAKLRIFELN